MKIAQVENSFGIYLPDDYKQCIKINNGGFPEPNVFDSEDGRLEGVFNNLISFTNKELNINMFLKFSSKKLFPFGKDPFGSLLCLDYRFNEKSPKIVFYDIEQKTITPICKSFKELIDRLYKIE